VTVQSAVVGVSVTPTPNPATVGSPVSFTATVTNPNNVPITTVRFTFGDGGSSTQTTGGNTATTQHTYQTSGTFTVTAVAQDAAGNSYSGSTQLIVNPRAAVQVTLDAAANENTNQFSCSSTYPKTCTTSFSAFVPPPGGQPGVRVVFTAAVSGGLAAAASYQWDFGDGSRETTSAASRDHLYLAPGTYTIVVRVTTTDGNVGEQRLTLVIGV
jgi:PKD repeat protein